MHNPVLVLITSLTFFFGSFFAGHIDHAARVMQVITWNKSFRGVNNGDGGKDDFDTEEYETHATVLDKLLAWEKKLYEEVKVHCLLFGFILCVSALLTLLLWDFKRWLFCYSVPSYSLVYVHCNESKSLIATVSAFLVAL